MKKESKLGFTELLSGGLQSRECLPVVMRFDLNVRRPELDDWYPENSNSGLSGGQIAGIVVSQISQYMYLT